MAIVKKGRQDLVMLKVLAPRLELFRGLADSLTELDERVAKLKFLPSSSVIILSDYAFAVSDDVTFLTTR